MDGKRVIMESPNLFWGIRHSQIRFELHSRGLILLGITLAGSILSCLVIGVAFVWIPSVIGFIEGIVTSQNLTRNFTTPMW